MRFGGSYDVVMPPSLQRLVPFLASSWVGYVAAALVPIAITLAMASLGWPAFIFEHLVLLLVLGVAVAWDLKPAIVAAIVAVAADNVLLRDPIGQPAISGSRDMIDLGLFVVIAVVVSWLVARAHGQRLAAQQSAQRERRAREERDRLIATVSHDLATPLGVLAGTVQFARKSGPRHPADLERLLVRLETATARATSLIRTLTDAQAVDSERLELKLAARDMRELVTPIAQMMDRFSDRHPMVLAMPDEPVVVRCDAERMQRVVENLLSNAIKYSPDGGTIEVSIAMEGGTAVLRVRDHGIGISPEALPRVFERSYRAPEAAAAAPGLGLGLHIAAHVIHRHDGTIEAHPANGAGTIVSVRIPLTAPHADAAEVSGEAYRTAR